MPDSHQPSSDPHNTPPAFTPALIIVDFQNDFCPPSGSLAVPQGRDIAPHINKLLHCDRFAAKIATQDWHPANHISFASNHGADKKAFEDTVQVINPLNASEKQDIRLWPVHCVQDSYGAKFVDELDCTLLTDVVQKGQDSRVEMYSAFRDQFKSPAVVDGGRIAGLLRDRGVTHCYVVGLAYDYCVKCTAVDAVEEGFVTCVVREATRAVDEESVEGVVRELRKAGVGVVSMDGEEVQRLFS